MTARSPAINQITMATPATTMLPIAIPLPPTAPRDSSILRIARNAMMSAGTPANTKRQNAKHAQIRLAMASRDTGGRAELGLEPDGVGKETFGSDMKAVRLLADCAVSARFQIPPPETLAPARGEGLTQAHTT